MLLLAGGIYWWRSGVSEEKAAYEATPLTTLPGSEEAPRFSPDGNQVVYRGNQQKQWDIYAKMLGGGPAMRLTIWAGPPSASVGMRRRPCSRPSASRATPSILVPPRSIPILNILFLLHPSSYQLPLPLPRDLKWFLSVRFLKCCFSVLRLDPVSLMASAIVIRPCSRANSMI